MKKVPVVHFVPATTATTAALLAQKLSELIVTAISSANQEHAHLPL